MSEQEIKIREAPQESKKTGEYGFIFDDGEFIKIADVWNYGECNIILQQSEEQPEVTAVFRQNERKFTLMIKPEIAEEK